MLRNYQWPILATIYLGHIISGGQGMLPKYLPATILLFLANMPLKDLRDSGGDAAAGVGNWADWLGQTRLLLLCSGLSLAGSLSATLLLSQDGWIRYLFAGVVLLPAINIAVHVLFGIDRHDLFTRGVRFLILICTVVVIKAFV